MVHVNQVAQFFGIVADILAVAALMYVVIVIKLAEAKFQKADVLLQFERKRRDEIFRQAMLILAISILFRFLMENGEAFALFSVTVTTVLYLLHKIMLVLFVFMIMRTTRETKH